jgi:hypothetical protein
MCFGNHEHGPLGKCLDERISTVDCRDNFIACERQQIFIQCSHIGVRIGDENPNRSAVVGSGC